MALTLLAPTTNPRAQKIQIAANYLGVKLEVNPDFKMGVDNKTKEFLEINPLGKVPALKTPEGPIFETHAILRHIAQLGNKNLSGKTTYEAAVVDQWMEFASTELEPPTAAWIYPILGIIPANKDVTNKAKGDIMRLLGVLNTHLATRTFLVGERVTLADISVVMTLGGLYKMVLEPGMRKKFPNTTRYFLTCIHQQHFASVLGTVTLCEKMMVAKEPEPKAPKEKPAAQPKPQAKAQPKEEDEAEAPKPKPKSKLDLLPPSKMVLDEWKRTYSNSDTRPVALPWLWENFDAEGYCWFFCEYKYNEELQKVFMTSNLIGGWFQRLDPLRKYGFGSVLIFGDEPKLSISGVWMFRGKEVPEEMTRCDDSEL